MASIAEELGYITVAIKKKLITIVIVFLVGFFVSFQFLDPVLERMKRDLLPEGVTLIYISPVEVIMLKLKMALVIGVILIIPLVFHYVYKALKVRFGIRNPMKKSHFILVVTTAVSLFVLGISYSYFLMLPIVLTYLHIMSAASGVTATYSIYEFVSFVIIITLVLSVAFEVPLILIFLVRVGLVPLETLKEYRRYIYVIMFVLAAFFTPPDVVSQLIVAIPLVIFYEIGIQIAGVFERKGSAPTPSYLR